MKDDIFRIKHNKIAPAQGRILIAEPFLRGYHFARSVVLIVEHHEDSTTGGLVLNKKTNIILNDHFPILQHTIRIPAYLGGPLSNNRLFFIHTLGDIIPDAQLISGELYVGGELQAALSCIAQDEKLAAEIKFFFGYSGWSTGQLAKEIEENTWLVSHTSSEHILQSDTENLWSNLLADMGKKYSIWRNYPLNPMMN